MTEDEIVKELEDRGIVIRNGHFTYTSGKHGREYIDKNTLLADTRLASLMAHMLVMKILGDDKLPWPQVVVGPALSGALFARDVGRELALVPNWSDNEPVYVAYAEKAGDNGPFVLRRNHDKIVRGRTVLVVEDVVNTGGSAIGTAHAVMEAGGIVIAIGVIWNRGEMDKLVLRQPGGKPLEMPLTALVHRPYPSLTPAQCKEYGPCAEGVRMNTDTGHGANFLELDKPRC